jgi:hypothetical protein
LDNQKKKVMKSIKHMKKGIVTLTISLIGITSFLQVNAQCEKKFFCEDDYDYEGDYDYRSQSSFAKLSPGDTSSVSVVLYGGQKYRLFVCADPDLGGVLWKIVNPERKNKRSIQAIKKDTLVINKVDADGNFITDSQGNLVVKEKKVTIDTIWKTERIAYDKVIYDNKKNTDKPYLEVIPKKSERYIIRVAVPGGDPNLAGCVNVYVGRLPVGSKSFAKQGRSGDTY